MQKGISNQAKLTVVVVAIVALAAYFAVLGLSRIGETKLSIEVIPSGAIVKLNGKPVSSKTLYLAQGEYTLSAEHKGYKNYSRVVDLGTKPVSIGLAPEPVSKEALLFLKENPDIQQRREMIGGDNAALNLELAKKKTPIIQYLPHTDVSGPYTIDYGPDPTRPGYIFLIISNSTAKGRSAALQWIQEQGQNPSEINIIYSNFINPIVEEGADHR